MKPVIIVDTREPWPHPWQRWIGDDVELVRGWSHPDLKKPACLPTGDFCLPSAFRFIPSSLLEILASWLNWLGLRWLSKGGAVCRPERLIERKTIPDFYGCCTQSRDRFVEELKRIADLRAENGTHTMIIVEGTWKEMLAYATIEHAMNEESLRETVKKWEARYCPIQFCQNEQVAARMAMHFLLGGMTEEQNPPNKKGQP